MESLKVLHILSNRLLKYICVIYSDLFESDVMDLWDYERSVDQYNTIGGTGKGSVNKQIHELVTWLSKA